MRYVLLLPALLLAAALAVPAAAQREKLHLEASRLALPGAPAAIFGADVDRDGEHDLVVVVAYTEWDQVGIEEQARMDDVDGLVEVLTIVPALFDRREIHVFGATDGGYEPLAEPLEMDRSVLSLAPGPDSLPVLALTDGGLAVLRLVDGELRFETLHEEPPVLAGTGSFLGALPFVHDLDGDGERDVLLPTRDGATVLLLGDSAVRRRVAVRYAIEKAKASGRKTVRHHPLAEVRDVTGDGLPDLVVPHHRTRWRHLQVLRGTGGGDFAAATAPFGPPPDRWSPDDDDDRSYDDEDDASQAELVHFGDLDGDGRAEYVRAEDRSSNDGGMRQEMREAKRPPFHYTFFRSRDDLASATEPYSTLDALGYAFTGGDEEDGPALPGGFQDLDGDGRTDLVTLTLDFSIFQAVRILATKSISIGIDFHVFCHRDGGFREVTNLDLSGKFRLNLRDLRIRQLSQFAGDFDGDGRADFVQMGRGKDVTIHRGRDGCAYPATPDLVVRLAEEPRDLSLVRIDDFDGDGKTDLVVIQPRKSNDPDVTAPVRLDIYRSGQ